MLLNRNIVCAAMALLAASPVHHLSAQTKKPPNIIFILTDDLGYGDIGVFFQNSRHQLDSSLPFELTPQIDKMAAHGAQFTQQYCNAPVCAPSRASLLTGVNQGNSHVRNNQFDKALEDNYTMGSVLKQAGYETVAIGKWGLQGEQEKAPNWPAHPLKRGFDHFFGYMRHTDGHEHYPAEGLYRGKKQVWDDYENVADQMDKCYTTDLWTAYAKHWILRHRSENPAQPFFIYLAYDAPHAVLELPTQSYPTGQGILGGLQWTGQPHHMINTAFGKIDSFIEPEYRDAVYDDDHHPETAPAPWPDTYKRYATAVSRIDKAVGDILALLQQTGLDSNTLVVFSSDNGPSIESYLPKQFVPNHPTFFGSYGPFDGIKRDCWEGGLRMPVIAWWPGKIAAGKLIDVPSMLSDWLATFCDAAYTAPPARTDGVSLLPSMTGIGQQQASTVYVEYFEGGRTPAFPEFEPSHRNRKRGEMQMIRLKGYVGVRYDIQHAADSFEIYDVDADPKQFKNLASGKEFSILQQKMKDEVLQLRRADSSAPRPYDKALIAPVSMKKIHPDFEWSFYAGVFSWVISVSGKTAERHGDATRLKNIPKFRKPGQLVATAYFYAPGDGMYQLSFRCDGKAVVPMHQAMLFDCDFGYQQGAILNATVWLQKGYHPLTISVPETVSGRSMPEIKWRNSSTSWKIFIH